MLLLELQASIQAVFNVCMPLVSMFESSTLRSMAAWIDRDARDAIAMLPIDWDEETSLTAALLNLEGTFSQASRSKAALIIILTGGTGQLGKGLLASLLAYPCVRHIHCIGVRNVQKRRDITALDESRVTLHEGDLVLPRLGMSGDEAPSVFEADVIIHNGADMSYLKTYATLRAANL
jgi:hybrid polyketide synthase / nonribosomal peptide synthetase ACE1